MARRTEHMRTKAEGYDTRQIVALYNTLLSPYSHMK